MSTSSNQPFRINSPCPAPWEDMKITAIGRHCLSCQKEVVDFRNMNRDEILIHLMTSGNGKTCGKFYRHQLDDFHLEDLVTPKELSKWPANKAFAILTLATSLLIACDNSPHSAGSIPSDKDSVSTTISDITYSSKANSIDQIETSIEDSNSNCHTILGKVDVPDTNEPFVELLGEVIIDEPIKDSARIAASDTVTDVDPDKEEVFQFVEEMPEFTGGTDSLFAFLKRNIHYPEMMIDAGMEGRVIVSFIVQKDGSITDSQVVKSLQPSADEEALRIVNAMPNWIPGKQRGKPVPVRLHLPIHYRLNY